MRYGNQSRQIFGRFDPEKTSEAQTASLFASIYGKENVGWDTGWKIECDGRDTMGWKTSKKYAR